MIDAHCHLTASYTTETLPPVIERFISQGGKQIIDVTTSYSEVSTSQSFVELFPKIVYVTLGIHPESSNGAPADHQGFLNDIKKIDDGISQLKNVIGIGETGIDFSHESEFPSTHNLVIDQQHELFIAQISVAKKHQLPLVIHARGRHVLDYQAYEDILTVLKQEGFSLPVYFHSFGGNYDLAKRIVDDGNYIGVNGIVTYSNAKDIAEAVTKIPLEHILLETDAPFLIPSNLDRKNLASAKTNEPFAVFYTAKRVAALKNISVEEVLSTTSVATKKVFVKML